MRYIISTILLLASFSSMAWVDLELVSGHYRMSARLTGDDGDISMGSVVAQSQSNGQCRGRYGLDQMAGLFSISFDGNNGPDSGGGCANESMTVDIGADGFTQLMGGAPINAIMYSVMYFYQPRDAVVRMTNRGDN